MKGSDSTTWDAEPLPVAVAHKVIGIPTKNAMILVPTITERGSIPKYNLFYIVHSLFEVITKTLYNLSSPIQIWIDLFLTFLMWQFKIIWYDVI